MPKSCEIYYFYQLLENGHKRQSLLEVLPWAKEKKPSNILK